MIRRVRTVISMLLVGLSLTACLPQPHSVLGKTCEVDAHCAPDVCVDGRCALEAPNRIGQACELDTQCGADLCIQSVCTLREEGRWYAVGEVAVPRALHTSTLLEDGTLLIAGGDGPDGAVAIAEIYDPARRTVEPVGSLIHARHSHTATLLKDGRVLVSGGTGENAEVLVSSETYDPLTKQWTQAGDMRIARQDHLAVRLKDGSVLVVSGGTIKADRFDPATSSWGDVTPPPQSFNASAFVQLADGRPLFVNASAVAIYDVTSNSWESHPGSFSRLNHRAALLSDGRVFVTGGTPAPGTEATSRTQYFHLDTKSWSEGPPMTAARLDHALVPLGGGRLLVAGGSSATGVQQSAETFDALEERWTPLPYAVGGYNQTLTALPDGTVVSIGGEKGPARFGLVELFVP